MHRRREKKNKYKTANMGPLNLRETSSVQLGNLVLVSKCGLSQRVNVLRCVYTYTRRQCSSPIYIPGVSFFLNNNPPL